MEATTTASSIAVTSSGADAIAFEARDADGRILSVAFMDASVFGKLLAASHNVWPAKGMAEASITFELAPVGEPS